MTHVLLPDDPDNKRRMLLAMAGSLVPDLWGTAARRSLASAGRLARFDSLTEAAQGIAALAPNDPQVRQTLDAALASYRGAEELNGRQDFAAAIDQAAQSAQKLETAFCLAQPSLPGEFRAFWCHNAFGLPDRSWDEAIALLAANGFTAIVPNMLWGGAAFYESTVLPVADGAKERGDQIRACLAACRKHGLQIHVWKVNWNLGHAAPKDFIDRMRREQRLQVDARGQELPWLCPSHLANRQMEVASMLEVARQYEVDGLHFDYIRYPDNQHCFCAGCRERFAEAAEVEVRDWPKDVLVGGRCRSSWLEWRRANISSVVSAVSQQARAIRPKIKISAAVFRNWPTDRDNVGQDWKAWCEAGWLDFVCPMDYTPRNGQFENMVAQQVQWAGATPCYPGIGASASSSRLGPVEVIEQIQITRRHNTRGFVIFNYGSLEAADLVPMLGLGITARSQQQ